MTNNTRVHQHEEERLRALQSLQILDTPIEERFERITRLARNAFNVPICAISCIDHERIWFKSSQGLDQPESKRCDSFCQHTIFQRETFVINDARFDDQFANNPYVCNSPGFVFYAGAPIYSPEGLPIAAFCLVDTEPRHFDENDLKMLNDFARLAEHEIYAQAPNQVEHQLVQQVGSSWRQTLIDPLTRLWNHEGIMAIADESLRNSTSKNTGMCIVMLDIKRFHEINTTLGHLKGDEILKDFSIALLHEVREDDSVGRIHSDEFLIVMNSLSKRANVSAAINRLQEFVDAYQVDGIDGRETLQSSLVAICVPSNWTGTLQGLLEQLDGSMYNAKQCVDSLPQIIDAKANLDADEHAA